jgi:hypothetical protein
MPFSRLKNILDKLLISNPNFIFLVSLAVFVTDSTINLFWDIPVFVPFIILILPLLWVDLYLNKKLNRFLTLFGFVFTGSFLITGFIYQFHRQSLSDLLFLLFFVTVFYHYKAHEKLLSIKAVHVFTVVIFLMFSFTFIGVNSGSFNKPVKEVESSEISTKKKVKHNNEPLDVLEYNRNYRYGIFRIPHIATYLLGFIGLFYAFLYKSQRKWIFLIVAGVAFLFMFYSGVRTYFAALLLAMAIYFMRRKTLWVLLAFSALGLLLVVFRYPVYQFTHNTLLEPFSSLVITMVDNIDRLSRILIWKSWWLEFQQFGWYNFLFGKSYFMEIEANIQNLHMPIWFHNDFLSIVYAYGVISLVFYVMFFIKVYRCFKQEIRSSFILFVFFTTMPVAAFINGMYYYFPVFVLFLFITLAGQLKTHKGIYQNSEPV